jgi:hypothetical protein
MHYFLCDVHVNAPSINTIRPMPARGELSNDKQPMPLASNIGTNRTDVYMCERTDHHRPSVTDMVTVI